jgi:MFS family permease
MLAIFTYPWWIFLSRTLDRFGKGLRTGARDAMLSDESSEEHKGRIFGFHRSLDTTGAVLGPALALVYLYFFPDDYTTLFLIAFLPGLAAVICTLLLRKEKQKVRANDTHKTISLFSFMSYWKESPLQYKKLAFGLLFFALFNSSDVFLLLKMKDSGLGNTAVIGIYIFYNLVYALLAYPMGKLADKIGLKKVFMSGLIIFVLVYAGFAFNNDISVYILLFALYGTYAAATEGIAKAWISNLVDRSETASAIGTFSGFQSLCTLVASSLCGILWYNFGASVTFLVTALMTIIVMVYLKMSDFSISNSKKPERQIDYL